MAVTSPRSGNEQGTAEHPTPDAGSRDLPPAGPEPGDLAQRDTSPHGVDPHAVDAGAEPSAEWGWHGTFPRATAIAGWFSAVALLFMLIGNHESNVENWWLVALGAGLILLLVGGRLNRRGSVAPVRIPRRR